MNRRMGSYLYLKNTQRFFLEPILVCSFYALIAFIILWKLILTPGVVGYARDWPFPFYKGQFALWAQENLSPYTEYAGGFPTVVVASYWIPVVFYFFTMLGMGADLTSKLTVFSVLIASGGSLYYLTRVIGVKRSSSLIAGLFYMLTPNVFGRFLEGHIVYLVSYALSPLVLALFIRSCDRLSKSYKSIILTGLIYGLAWAQGQFVFMLFGLLLLYTLFTTKISEFKVRVKIFLSINLIASLIQLPLLTSFFYAPSQAGTLISATPLSFLGRFEALSSTLTNAFVLKSYLVDPHFYNGIVLPSYIWNAVAFALPICAIIALFINHKTRRLKHFSLYFGLLILIGLFIVTGVNSPFVNLKIWILLNVPFGLVLEDPYHYSFLLCLSYAILLSIFSDRLQDKLFTRGGRHLTAPIERVYNNTNVFKTRIAKRLSFKWQLLVSASISVLILTSSVPFFTGNLNGAVQVYSPPAYYEKVYDYFGNMTGDFRVTWMPMSSVGISEYSHIQPVRDPIVTAFSKPDLDTATFRWDPFVAFMARTIGENKTKYFGQLLGLMNVKYIITRNDFIPYYVSVGNQTSLMNGQEKVSWIKSFGELKVFENGFYLPHIYRASEAVLVAGDLSVLLDLGYYLGNQSLPPIIFSSQLSPSDNYILSAVNTVVVQNNDFIDLLLPFIPTEYRIQPGSFATVRASWEDGWTQSATEVATANWYYYTQIENVAITARSDTLAIPFDAPVAGKYVIYAKVFYGSDASNLTFSIGNYSKTINAKTLYDEGFKWVELGSASLTSGNHQLKILSQSGKNAVGLILIVPSDVFSNAEASASKILTTKSVILIAKPQSITDQGFVTFSNSLGNEVSDGSAMQTLGPTGISFRLWAPLSGLYDTYVRTNSPSSINASSGKTYLNLIDSFENISGWYQAGNPVGIIQQTTFVPSMALSKFSISYSFVVNKSSTSAYILAKKFPSEDWSQYNTIGFWVYPQVNVSVAYLFFGLRNGANQWYGQYYYLPANQWSYINIDMSNWSRRHVNEVRLAEVGNQWGNYANGQHVKLFFTDLTLSKRVNTTRFDWYSVGDIHLSQGWNNMILNVDQANVGIDMILLKPVMENNGFKLAPVLTEVSYSELSPWYYSVNINSSKPFFLIFSENYSPSWYLAFDSHLIEPLPAYGYLNLYYVNETGDFNALLQYSPQFITTWNTAINIAFVTVLICGIFLVFPLSRLRRCWR